MRAILPFGQGSEGGVPRIGDWPEPTAGPGEILVRVAAAGVNRADLLQLRGLYPPVSYTHLTLPTKRIV